MAKNKNKEKPKQNKAPGMNAQSTAENNTQNNTKGQGTKKDNTQGKDFYA